GPPRVMLAEARCSVDAQDGFNLKARRELLAEQVGLLANAAKAGDQQQLDARERRRLLHLAPRARRRRREPLRPADDVRLDILEISGVTVEGAPRIAAVA